MGIAAGLLPQSLSDSSDSVAWALAPSGRFTVGFVYRDLFRGPVMPWTTQL